MEHRRPASIVAVMGVSGAGKSSLGRALAVRVGLPFLEGDDFHPPRNRALMAAGTPLGDDDRWPWLDALGRAVAQEASTCGGAVFACSALRRVYRDRLEAAVGRPILFVWLAVDPATLRDRLSARADHFMPASLLHSQLATLEPPGPDEWSITMDGNGERGALVDALVEAIG